MIVFFYLYFSAAHPLKNSHMEKNSSLHATNFIQQIKILLRRGLIMCKRDTVRFAYFIYVLYRYTNLYKYKFLFTSV